jgi:hypothetical protein
MPFRYWVYLILSEDFSYRYWQPSANGTLISYGAEGCKYIRKDFQKVVNSLQLFTT